MDLNGLRDCFLFQGVADEDIKALLSCLGAAEKKYRKKDFIYRAGQRIERIGVVLEGKLQIINEDFSGNRHIIGEAGRGDLFAEAFICAGLREIPYYVMAVEDSRILFLNYGKVVNTCSSSCKFHSRLIENMISVLALKNVSLAGKLDHVTRRSTREKLLSYLSDQARLRGGRSFDIPFDRQELADYLCVDRSAMSGELGKLKREGVIACNRNHFELLE